MDTHVLRRSHWPRYALAGLWLINGLFCKVFGLVPRHELIVGETLGRPHAHVLTSIIGLLEVGMALWIISGKQARACAVLQVVVIATMNTIEFLFVPHLLLWGRTNALFAFLLILFIAWNTFGRNARTGTPAPCSAH